MTPFMADLIPRLVDDAQRNRLEDELQNALSLSQLHPAGAAN